MATLEAAQAIGWDHRIGSLEAGKAADLVVIDNATPHLCLNQHPVVDLVRYGSRAEVRDVMINGRLVLDDRRLTTIDLDRLAQRARAVGKRIAEVVAPRRYQPLSPAVVIHQR